MRIRSSSKMLMAKKKKLTRNKMRKKSKIKNKSLFRNLNDQNHVINSLS
jgi:hypothetical protein